MVNVNELSNITIANDGNFRSEVLESKSPVFVDFYTTWCGPCKYFSNVLTEVAPSYNGKIKFVKVNVDENPDLAAKMGIYSVPTLMFVKEGNIKKAIAGALPKEAFVKELDYLIS